VTTANRGKAVLRSMMMELRKGHRPLQPLSSSCRMICTCNKRCYKLRGGKQRALTYDPRYGDDDAPDTEEELSPRNDGVAASLLVADLEAFVFGFELVAEAG